MHNELQHPTNYRPELKEDHGTRIETLENSELYLPNTIDGACNVYACTSFPIDILGKAFSASFRFSRNDANCQGSHRPIIKSLGHPGGSTLGGNSIYSVFFYFGLQLQLWEKNRYDPRVWMGVNNFF